MTSSNKHLKYLKGFCKNKSVKERISHVTQKDLNEEEKEYCPDRS